MEVLGYSFMNCFGLSWVWSFGSCGLGLGYVSPVSTLIRWFPDRRGMATGMAIMGFGGGAMIGAPLISYLLELYYVTPVYLGSASDVILKTIDGIRYTDINGVMTEVVVLAAGEVSNVSIERLCSW